MDLGLKTDELLLMSSAAERCLVGDREGLLVALVGEGTLSRHLQSRLLELVLVDFKIEAFKEASEVAAIEAVGLEEASEATEVGLADEAVSATKVVVGLVIDEEAFKAVLKVLLAVQAEGEVGMVVRTGTKIEETAGTKVVAVEEVAMDESNNEASLDQIENLSAATEIAGTAVIETVIKIDM